MSGCRYRKICRITRQCKWIVNNCALLICDRAFFGKRRTGKSTTITNIAYHCFSDIPFGIVMSDTAYAGYWETIVPKQFIVQGLRQDVLNWLKERQKKAVAKYGIDDPRIKAFIILDDVIADQKTIRYSADLASFFVEG